MPLGEKQREHRWHRWSQMTQMMPKSRATPATVLSPLHQGNIKGERQPQLQRRHGFPLSSE